MASYEALFLKTDETPCSQLFKEIGAFLRKHGLEYGEEVVLHYQENHPWIQIQNLPWLAHLFEERNKTHHPKFAPVLSRNFQTEVICLYTQTVVDAVGYWHFQNGVEKRCLMHGFYDQYTWEEVRGAAEEWENEVFYNLQNYADILLEEDDLAEVAIALCQTKQLKTGLEFPFFSSSDIRRIAEHFRLPGFSKRLDWSIEAEI